MEKLYKKQQATILVVDDSKTLCAIIKKMLSENGFAVIIASNGYKCLEILETEEPDLILLDIVMHKINGIEVCKKIKTDQRYKNIPVLLMSSKEDVDKKLEGFEAGAVDYIIKPFMAKELTARILVHLRLRTLLQNLECEVSKRQQAENKLLKYSTQLEKKVTERTAELVYANKHLETGIEDQKKTQYSLEKSKKKYRDLVETIGEWIWEMNADGVFTYASPSIFKITGYKPEEILGKTPFDLTPPEESEKAARLFREKKANKKSLKWLEHNYLHKNGNSVIVETNGAPFFDSKGNLLGYRGVNRDITEKKQIEKEKKKLKAQLLQSEKMASIGQLAAGVAHEINNPTGFVSSNLNSFSDYVDDIKTLLSKYNKLIKTSMKTVGIKNIPPPVGKQLDDILEFEEKVDINFILDDTKKLIEDCIEGTDRIKNIVTSMKNFAHPGENKPSYSNINKNIDSTLNIVWNEIKYKAKVIKHYGDIPEVLCYSQQINQVFMNLLVNAAQSIQEKGTITISTRADKNYVEIEISDTGSGIKVEHLSKIFDPFFTTKDVGKGTGMGLNVSYNIIKKHNGTIDVKSKEKEGTTFTIRLNTDNSILNNYGDLNE